MITATIGIEVDFWFPENNEVLHQHKVGVCVLFYIEIFFYTLNVSKRGIAQTSTFDGKRVGIFFKPF